MFLMLGLVINQAMGSEPTVLPSQEAQPLSRLPQSIFRFKILPKLTFKDKKFIAINMPFLE